MKPKIIAFAASTRAGSFNQSALEIAAQGAAEAGADVTLVSLEDYPMPLYQADEEETDGIPTGATELGKLIAEQDGILLASPEYNGFFSPLLKNTLDWLSRLDDNPLPGKTAAILAASPGGLGGLRALPYVHLLLNNLGVTVLPQPPAIGSAHESLQDSSSHHHDKLKKLGAQLAKALS